MIPLDILILNSDYKIYSIHFIQFKGYLSTKLCCVNQMRINLLLNTSNN
jgi:hypothetical protein